MNYEITGEWQTLSKIMGENYDNSKMYRIHNNVEKPAKLCLTDETNSNVLGRKYPEYCEIYVAPENNPKIKVISSLWLQNGHNIEITEVV